ncbi:MAG: hypothetical protein ACE5G2_07400, partial [Candidatus Krumholzibacteriia bacterium]
MSRIRPIVTALAAALTVTTHASADTLIHLDRFELGELQVVGFELPRAARIEIEAVGVWPRHSAQLSAYAWILDTETRAPVWVMERRNTSRVSGKRLLREAMETLELEAGRYELYAFAGARWRTGRSFRRIIGLHQLRDLFRGDSDWRSDPRAVERAVEDCSVKLSSPDVSQGDLVQFEPTGEIPGALLRYTRLGDSEYIKTGFTVSKPTDLRIYSIIEFPEDWRHPVDHGWIVDAATRERVWQMDDRNTRHAGGDEKNRMFDDEIHLEKGDYILYYGTDDSHAYEEFSANPPHDPLNWGITILPGENSDRGALHVTEAFERGEPLVELIRARDYEFLEQPFRLQKDGELQVYAIGEYSYGDRGFTDYGWIQKAGSSEVVWEMTRRSTFHAGGAQKNRMFDESIRLPAGTYVAHYVTDDSHSFRNWNADAPFDRRSWGLTIYAGAGLRVDDFELLSEDDLPKNPDVLVRIVRVGDRERLRERFTLDKETRIHIYALGEGRDDMYDYGWIEEVETGEIVWEMTW